ncbi:MAG: hypothetical protein IJI68_04455 [Eggerthellaceae bacterium]|nr:hypothetical protein [Eggerthellaceae bacterium]
MAPSEPFSVEKRSSSSKSCAHGNRDAHISHAVSSDVTSQAVDQDFQSGNPT